MNRRGWLVGREVQYEHKGRVTRGVVIAEMPAELLNVETMKHVKARRFVIRTKRGREITTCAMR